jgi:chorismate mutase/prephenate dehydratase
MDTKLIKLLVKRASYVKEVGRRKKLSNLAEFRPEREVEIIERMCKENEQLHGHLESKSIATIWLEIISGCRSLEKRLKIAFLGPSGTYSELAARTLFGHQVDLIPFDSLEEVMDAGEKEICDISLLPVENSIEGTVGRTLDLFLSTSLKISAEISIPINHLLLRKKTGFEKIEKIVAHSQALLQCNLWLNKNLPSVPRISVESNGVAAKMASESSGIVAIAGQIAADNYGLLKLASKIENNKNNRTRFAALGSFEPELCGIDHTSLILAVPDEAGAMYSLIEPLAKHGVSMKRFESRPAKRQNETSWHYYFYSD